ncbi:hypothetical protein NLK61_02390 [Pseudomonas fuscovaginae UPB0736]|uniref:hypothetical protein n=1 Tax=Pseudomonas asplenii TaxID=53407 RepID=UPI00028A261F|nr:hypothetical protein [Pseudomonas fuscovaginae]UUQ65523.1 hypothetical protein NLK61_02390 [Pseudomonas fuscovaginae UPB0736]
MSQNLSIEDYIAQTQQYREQYFKPYSSTPPTLGDFLAMPYDEQIRAIRDELSESPASDALKADFSAWAIREQHTIDNFNEKNRPFEGSWWPGGPIIASETYTLSTIGDSLRFLVLAMQEALLNGNSRVCGYMESVDDQKRWCYLFNCIEYDENGQTLDSFLRDGIAEIGKIKTEFNHSHVASVNGIAVSKDLDGVTFLRKGTCRAVLVRTIDYVNPQTANITGYRHNFSMIDHADFDSTF